PNHSSSTERAVPQFLPTSVRLICGAVGIAMFATWAALAADPAPDDAKAIRQLLTDQAAAWNRGDLDGFMAGYWRDPNLTFFSEGTVTRGWDATMERYRKKYQAEGK